MEVFNDGETRRILGLPRRQHEWSAEDAAKATSVLTDYLKTEKGTRKLLPIQARALAEIYQYGYLVGRLGPGSGKTLLSFLIPTVMGDARTLLLVPAKLKVKTVDEYWEWAEHFRLPRLQGVAAAAASAPGTIYVQSYEAISHINYAAFISEMRPTRIVCDEAHFLAHLTSGRSKRVFRYLTKEAPETKFTPLSGTFWRRSIREAAHLFEAATGKANSPLPTQYQTLEQWGAALDEGVRPEARIGPGALLQLCPEARGLPAEDRISVVRRAVQDRISATPGVITTTQASCPLPLTVQVVPLSAPPEIRAALTQLREEYVMPDGSDAGEPLQVWAAARQISCGFAYRFNPPPPKEWRDARRGWNQYVRDRLSNPGNMTLDTPLQVWNAVADGKFGDVPEWHRWVAVRDTFEPKTEPFWVSDFAVRAAEEWALTNGGIVWCGHNAVSDDSESDDVGKGFTKIPYFGAGQGSALRKHRGPCAASIQSHGTGLNLQHYHKALIMCMPSSGATLEQLLARHHREGQKADLVEFYFFAHTKEIVSALETALKDARFMEDTTGNPQRILQADLLDNDAHKLNFRALSQGAA